MKTSGAIRQQRDAMAFQVFDQKTLYLLKPRYIEKSSVKGRPILLSRVRRWG